MTRVLIIGGGGMVGQKLAHRIAAHGLAGDPAPHVTLYDLAFPPDGAPAAERIAGDLAQPSEADRIAAPPG